MNEITRRMVECAESAGYETRSYSGRGMFGKTCLAVEGDSIEDIIVDMTAEIADSGNIDLLSYMKKSRTDSMGLGVVVYWPSIPAPEDESEE